MRILLVLMEKGACACDLAGRLGLTPKTEVALPQIAPMGGPVQIKLWGYELTLRRDEAQKITVEQVHEKSVRLMANSAGLLLHIQAWASLEGPRATMSTTEKRITFEHLVSVMEAETELNREASLANMRFSFIESLCAKTVVRPHESKEHQRSMAIDRVLTGKYTSIPCFIGIMALVFILTFNFIGAALFDWMRLGIDVAVALIDRLLSSAQVSSVAHSLGVDGICDGVGSVLSMLPIIAAKRGTPEST